tara:strand:+ start:2443 stop:4164 length:1722 start_codon:yes stop_codon:yes gene_type:complete
MSSVYIPEQEFDANLHNQYFDKAKVGTLDVLGATLDETLYYNPANALGRLADQFIGEGTRGEILTAEEYQNSEYFRKGIEVGEKGIKTGLANLLAERYDKREEFNFTLNRSRGGFRLGAAQFGVAILGSFLDPLNIASAFIPAVGTARAATMASRYGKTGSRAMVGAIDGAVGATVVEPLVIGAAFAEQDADYGLMDSFLNIAVGSALGGGLHVGFGALSDRVSKLPPSTRDTAQRISLGQVIDDKPVNIEPLIDDAEAFEIARGLRPDDKKVVYNASGEGRVVDVLNVDEEGNITIKDVDGTEKILDASDVFSKSPFDEDFEIEVAGVVISTQKLSNSEPEDIQKIIKFLSEVEQNARDSGDFVTVQKAEIAQQAIFIEGNKRLGTDLEKPAEPDITQARQNEIQELEEEIQRFETKMQRKADEAGEEKPKLSTSEKKEYFKKTQRLQELRTNLSRAETVKQIQEGTYTAQQVDNVQNAQRIDGDNLGALSEFKEDVERIEKDTIESDEIDLDEIQAENELLEQDLQVDEVQALLTEDFKASIRDTTLDAKADKYEEISRAGGFCVRRTRGT